eukprot:4521368-Prymnesium_polylepis.1
MLLASFLTTRTGMDGAAYNGMVQKMRSRTHHNFIRVYGTAQGIKASAHSDLSELISPESVRPSAAVANNLNKLNSECDHERIVPIGDRWLQRIVTARWRRTRTRRRVQAAAVSKIHDERSHGQSPLHAGEASTDALFQHVWTARVLTAILTSFVLVILPLRLANRRSACIRSDDRITHKAS